MTFQSLLRTYIDTDDDEIISDAFNAFMNENAERTENGDEIVTLHADYETDMFMWIANGLKCNITQLSILKVIIHQ